MLLSAVSVLVVAQPSSEVPEGLMNYPVYHWRMLYNVSHKIRYMELKFNEISSFVLSIVIVVNALDY
jgi:hypothetical protein